VQEIIQVGEVPCVEDVGINTQTQGYIHLASMWAQQVRTIMLDFDVVLGLKGAKNHVE
jgi:hypothetical protein